MQLALSNCSKWCVVCSRRLTTLLEDVEFRRGLGGGEAGGSGGRASSAMAAAARGGALRVLDGTPREKPFGPSERSGSARRVPFFARRVGALGAHTCGKPNTQCLFTKRSSDAHAANLPPGCAFCWYVVRRRHVWRAAVPPGVLIPKAAFLKRTRARIWILSNDSPQLQHVCLGHMHNVFGAPAGCKPHRPRKRSLACLRPQSPKKS